MERRTFGKKAAAASVVGLGTWQMEGDDRAAAIEALRRGLDLGMNHIDTAEMYGSGEVERLVGDAIAGRRQEAFLVSKVLPHNASFAGTVAACERTLARLRTDHLDAYLLHWRGSHPLAETLRAFEELVRQGKIRAWGVSNFDVDDLEEARSLVGEGKIACNQVLYHLEERAIEERVLPWCEAHGVALVAYSPLGAGSFPKPRSPGGAVLHAIAKEHGVTPHAVALRFLARRPSTLVIPKASRKSHVEANARADRLPLSEDDVRRIDGAFPMRPAAELPTL